MEIERRAVLAHLTDPQIWKHANGTRYDIAPLPTSGWQIAVASGARGNKDAAALTTEAILAFRPAAILFVGIAGALWEDVTLGEVVVATKVYGVHGGRDEPSGFMDRPESWQPNLELLELAKQIDRDWSWRTLARGRRKRELPHVHFAAVAAGEVILNNPIGAFAKRLRRSYNDAIALDTESIGFAGAVHRHRGTRGLVVRSVSDLAGWIDKANTDADGWREAAAANAAGFAVTLLTRFASETEPAAAPPSTEVTTNSGLAPDLGTGSSDLPVSLSTFIGRAEELRVLVEKVRRGDNRLMTLVGMGGIGKTRLVIEIARRARDAYPGGTVYVDFADASDLDVAASKLSSAFAVSPGDPGEVIAAVQRKISKRPTLLVADTCDRIVGICSPLIDRLLQQCESLRIVATSRERLMVNGERMVQVGPFATVSSGDTESMSSNDGVRLFVDRARLVVGERDFTDDEVRSIAAVCYRLEGVPLAIELAAARLRDLGTVDELYRRLDPVLRMLVGDVRDVSSRQRTMMAAIEWSYEFLTAPERRYFAWLAAFRGGWSLELAEDHCPTPARSVSLDLHRTLVEKSMVVGEVVSGWPRYRLLDMMREFTYTKLDDLGERSDCTASHAAVISRLCAAVAKDLWEEDQRSACAMLELEHDNIRAALEWSTREDPALAQMIVAACWRFWQLHAHYREAMSWLRKVIAFDLPMSKDRAELVLGGSYVARSLWQMEEAEQLSRRSIAMFEALGDTTGKYRAASNLAILLRARGELAQAAELFRAGLADARRTGDRRAEGYRLMNLGMTAMFAGDADTAEREFTDALHVLTECQEQLGLQGLGKVRGCLGRQVRIGLG